MATTELWDATAQRSAGPSVVNRVFLRNPAHVVIAPPRKDTTATAIAVPYSPSRSLSAAEQQQRQTKERLEWQQARLNTFQHATQTRISQTQNAKSSASSSASVGREPPMSLAKDTDFSLALKEAQQSHAEFNALMASLA